MKKIMAYFLLLILITAAFMADAYALTPPRPEPRRIHLGDGRVFHLTPPEFEAQGYPKSGLYQDGELVYTFGRWELWSHVGQMFFSNDAMSFLVVPNSPFGVIGFYERGVLTHYHDVQSLLRHGDRMLGEPCEFSGKLINWGEIRLDRANDRLQIITLEGYKIMFDLSTGFILSQYISPEHVPEEQQSGQISTIALVGGPLLILGVIIVLVKKFSHKK
ncbi:MAG: hypothetical protein FWC96_07710 [Oscillospiraceae bacterium]|nr:hypothetical protein [Oscillospiraceae bacterium]